MATAGGNRLAESCSAAADLRTKQFYILELTAARTVNVCNAATDAPFGVLQNKPNTGQAAEVVFFGTTKVISDGSGTAIAAGDFVGPNASGKAVKKATNDFSICGRAMAASTTDGAVIEILFTGAAFWRSAAG